MFSGLTAVSAASIIQQHEDARQRKKEIAAQEKLQRLRERVAEFSKTMQCNCDLDSWEPERDTGHSWVCRIHRAAKGRGEPVRGNND